MEKHLPLLTFLVLRKTLVLLLGDGRVLQVWFLRIQLGYHSNLHLFKELRYIDKILMRESYGKLNFTNLLNMNKFNETYFYSLRIWIVSIDIWKKEKCSFDLLRYFNLFNILRRSAFKMQIIR